MNNDLTEASDWMLKRMAELEKFCVKDLLIQILISLDILLVEKELDKEEVNKPPKPDIKKNSDLCDICGMHIYVHSNPCEKIQEGKR